MLQGEIKADLLHSNSYTTSLQTVLTYRNNTLSQLLNNGTNPPTKKLDSNVQNAASQTGLQTSFIVLRQAKNSFFSIQILVSYIYTWYH